MEVNHIRHLCRLYIKYSCKTKLFCANPFLTPFGNRQLSVLGIGTWLTKGGNCNVTTLKTVAEQIQHRSHHRYSLCGRYAVRNGFASAQLVSTRLQQVINSDNGLSSIKAFNKGRHFSIKPGADTEGTQQKNSHEKGQDGLPKEHQEIRENILTIPNLLTTSRMVLTPIIGYLVLHETFTWALGLFLVAGLTDLLDGFIARNVKNQTSALGTALDPLADKFLMTILTLSVTSAGLLPLPLAVVIVGRDVLLVAAAFYIRFISLTPPRTVRRYFDVTIPTAELHPSTISKINTALQLSMVSLTLASPVFDFVDHPALQALWVLTGITTLWSGVSYVITRNSNVKFLRKEMERKF